MDDGEREIVAEFFYAAMSWQIVLYALQIIFVVEEMAKIND